MSGVARGAHPSGPRDNPLERARRLGSSDPCDAPWRGTVEEIPDQVVPRRIRPEDPGRPTDTRILAVKIALAGPTPLKLGQRVEVEIAAPPRR
jgi:hypothetical protein